MGKRRDRFDRRAVDQALARSANGPRKAAERQRRAARMQTALKAGRWPDYTRAVRNWVAVQLGKPEARITPDDVKRLLKA
jgi:hypothetical protein